MRWTRVCAVLAAGALLLAGCGGKPPGDAARIDAKLVSDLAPGDAGAVAQSVNAFGFDLFHRLAGKGGAAADRGNTITSPLSVATLLAMILAGADGDTATRMADVLHLGQSRDVRVGALLRTLSDTDDVTLSVADALWAGRGTPLEEDYVSYVRRTLGATLKQGDLGSPETARAIDEWVKDNTGGRIDRIAGDLGLPDANAVLVLLNAVYFLGEWTTTFESARTGPFAGTPGVPTMYLHHAQLPQADLDGYRMLRLPYGEDGRFGMEIMLPDEGTSLDAVLGRLDAASWRAATGRLRETEIDEVALPRFELRWSGDLTGPLHDLGVPGSGFRAMSRLDPSLTKVVHKTYIRVDEHGTEAAAVSGAVMTVAGRAGELNFRVDRPFAFTISDRRTGAILFLGTVTDPR